MKDKTFIKLLIAMLVLFIGLAVYQLCVIKNLSSTIEFLEKDRNKVIEKYNEENRNEQN